MTDDWQQEVSDRMKRLKLSLEALRSGKKLTPDPEKKKVEALIREVEKLLKAVEEDQSKGVHNFIYAQKILSDAEGKVHSAKKSILKWLE